MKLYEWQKRITPKRKVLTIYLPPPPRCLVVFANGWGILVYEN